MSYGLKYMREYCGTSILRFLFKQEYVSKKYFSEHKKPNLAGVYPPITTPFDNNEDIAYVQLQRNLEKWNSIPFRGLVIQGSNGEFASLTENERVGVVKFVKKHMSVDKLLIAGSGCEDKIPTRGRIIR